MRWRFWRSVLAAVIFASCVPTPVQAPGSAPATSTLAAEPTRPPSCPANYPDPAGFDDMAHVGTGTVVAVIDPEQMRVTVDVPTSHPFAGQTLLLHLHGSARIPGGPHDLVTYGLRAGDRVLLNIWHFLPGGCSYVVVRVEKTTQY